MLDKIEEKVNGITQYLGTRQEFNNAEFCAICGNLLKKNEFCECQLVEEFYNLTQ